MNGRQTTETRRTAQPPSLLPPPSRRVPQYKTELVASIARWIQKYQKIDDNNKYKILPKKLFLLQKIPPFTFFR